MRRLLPLLLLVAGCSSAPTAAGPRDPDEELLRVMLASPDAVERGRAADLLGRRHRRGGAELAPAAYLEALKEAPSAAVARELLAHAHFFPDPEGKVRAILIGFLEGMPVATPAMIANVAMLGGDDTIPILKNYVYRRRDAESDPARDEAIRALGREARRGRVDVTEFLVNCTMSGNEMLQLAASRELSRVAGPNPARNWRGWWLERARQERADWLAASIWIGQGKTFDPSDPAAWADLIAGLDPAEDLEPAFHLAQRHFGLRFGWVAPHDLFDPSVDPDALQEGNRRALGLLKAWWAETSPFLVWRPGAGGYEIDRAARERSSRPGWERKLDLLLELDDYAGALTELDAAPAGTAFEEALRTRRRGDVVAAGRAYFNRQAARAAMIEPGRPEQARDIWAETAACLGPAAEFADETRRARERAVALN